MRVNVCARVCVYMYACTCMCVYRYAWMCAYVCVVCFCACMHATLTRVSAFMFVGHLCTYAYACTHAHVCIHACRSFMYVCIWMHTCACMYARDFMTWAWHRDFFFSGGFDFASESDLSSPVTGCTPPPPPLVTPYICTHTRLESAVLSSLSVANLISEMLRSNLISELLSSNLISEMLSSNLISD